MSEFGEVKQRELLSYLRRIAESLEEIAGNRNKLKLAEVYGEGTKIEDILFGKPNKKEEK